MSKRTHAKNAKNKKFIKLDGGKPRFELIPPEAMFELAKVFTFGAAKYNDDNWRLCKDWRRIYGAMQRHLHKYHNGEVTDKESGLPHLAHAMCNLSMLLWKDLK